MQKISYKNTLIILNNTTYKNDIKLMKYIPNALASCCDGKLELLSVKTDFQKSYR